MSIVTTQLNNRYYKDYLNTEVTFTKDIIRTLKMDPRQIYIKCAGSQWPCIINSTSFTTAKIILGTKGGAYEVLSKKDPPPLSVRFSFYQQDGQLMSFFVSGKVYTIKEYAGSSDLVIVTVQYTQRPPEDLIGMLGHLLDANVNYLKRREVRIPITAESLRKLGIPKKESIIYIQNVPRHCILSDISFGGAKVILIGIAQYLINKTISLQLEFDEPHEVITLTGIITSTEAVEGRKDILAACIKFDDSSITLSYKIHINNYLTTMRKAELNTTFADDLQQAAGAV